jgi:hypothetical protein
LLFDNLVSDFYQFKDWSLLFAAGVASSRVFVNTRLYFQSLQNIEACLSRKQ